MNKITAIIKLKKEISEIESPKTYLSMLIVDLYPISKDTVIPKDAIDSEIYDIPEGYYAVMANSDNTEMDG